MQEHRCAISDKNGMSIWYSSFDKQWHCGDGYDCGYAEIFYCPCCGKALGTE